MGLRLGRGADAVLLVEPDPGMASVLRCYPQPERLRAVAEIIRGWKDEEPRALWERLRAEGRTDAASQVILNRWSFSQRGPHIGYGGPGSKAGMMGQEQRDRALGCEATAARVEEVAIPWPPTLIHEGPAEDVEPREVARWLWVQGHQNSCGTQPAPQYLQPDGQPDGSWKAPPRDWLASRVADLAEVRWPPTLIHEGPAEDVEPREVASWLVIQQGQSRGKPIHEKDGEFWTQGAPGGIGGGAECRVSFDSWSTLEPLPLANRIESISRDWPPTSVYQGPCEDIEPPGLEGVVAYLDGPYHGDGSRKITGYAHEFPREAQLSVARKWSEAGAVVAVSECVPLADELGEGWHAVEITNERKGQRRSFSRQKREFLTLNQPPAWKPSVQVSLFGGAC